MLDSECVLNELIKLIEIDVRKELRGKIPNRNTFPLEERGFLRNKALDDVPKKPQCLLVLYALAQNIKQTATRSGNGRKI